MGRQILIPVDGSSHSKRAFEFALDSHPGATLTLLHVINPLSSMGYTDDDYFDIEGFQREEQHRRENAEALLDELAETADDRGFEVETVLRLGLPAREILLVAEELPAEQIVMGSRGRSGVGRVLFGSVAETVTRRSEVPVTVVR